ncbi:hypothetical protein A2761_02330 [Candidatus Kaiserbacteria bacterium RIFCSPHIGHO2_01_FULL_51_33]|nr:MAG: hypothetical protein A2761_02330 [Candidatus Kaiserbacteria bacterium RIFCSPHIGHO2_01_FULL_51_33]
MAAQVAGDLYESITGQLFELGRQLRQPNGYPFNPEELKAYLQDAIEGRFNRVVPEPHSVSTAPPAAVLNRIGGLVQLPATAEKKTEDCFRENLYGYRDGNIDRWLSTKQGAEVPSPASIYALGQELTFIEMAQAVLKVSTRDVGELVSFLVERNHVFALPQIESLIERQEKGTNVGLRTDSWANFFFVIDKNDLVSVVFAGRRDGGWDVDVYRLDYGYRWDADYRLFVRNSDAATL